MLDLTWLVAQRGITSFTKVEQFAHLIIYSCTERTSQVSREGSRPIFGAIWCNSTTK